MTENWVIAAKRADFRAIGEMFHIDPVVARLIRNRDVVGEEEIRRYLHGTLSDLADPFSMKGVSEAVSLLLSFIRGRRRIRIIGDYDIDGIMSSYILLTGLRALGAEADVRIPERIRDGYGLNENLVRQAAADGAEVLLTCDNGISAADQIRLAGELGLRTIVTDHHDVPFVTEEKEGTDEEGNAGGRRYVIPPADAVIDPKQEDCAYPFKGLCGAGVAFRLLQALYAEAGKKPAETERFLPYVAVATIGDVMDLIGENRILVREGLARLPHAGNPGLEELIRQNGLEPEQVDVYHVGFVIGPCLNASGRLDTAERALRLLMTEDAAEAARLAGDLISLNVSRKAMTEQGVQQAMKMAEETELRNDRVLVVFLPDCHESIAGIVAGRLKEHYNRPAFVLTRTEDQVKGSGRSVPAYSMYEELTGCRELLTRFGGHPMAAGLSLPEENVEKFRKKLNERCTLTEQDLTPKVTIDIAMPFSYLSEDLIRQIALLRPFGKGNARPLFAQKDLRVSGLRVFGKNRNAARMTLSDQTGRSISAVYFGEADSFADFVQRQDTISVIYYPGVNEWQGRRNLQLTIVSYR